MALLNHWLLVLAFFLPAVGAAVVLWIRKPAAVRWTSLATTLTVLVIVPLLLIPFKWRHSPAPAGASATRFHGGATAAPAPSIELINVDGLSFPMIALTTLIFVAACCASWRNESRPRTYFAMLLSLESTVIGFFLARNLVLLTLCLAVGLVPMCLLIGGWGDVGRRRAAKRFALYMLGGLASLAICLIALDRLGGADGTLDLGYLATHHIAVHHPALFALAALGLLVRLPVAPLHAWLESVLTQATPAVAMVVGVLVPLTGGYGLFRVLAPLFPDAVASAWPILAGVGAGTILYSALAALAQNDLGRFVAHASIVTAGFVLLGAAERTPAGANGAVFLLLGQGLIGALLILLAGLLRRTPGGGHLSQPGGLGAAEPLVTTFFVIAVMGQFIAPGLLGQLMVFFGAFQIARPDSLLGDAPSVAPYVLAAVVGVGIVLTAPGFVRMMVALSGPAPIQTSARPRLAGEDLAAFIPLAVVLLVLGAGATMLCFVFSQPALEAVLRQSL